MNRHKMVEEISIKTIPQLFLERVHESENETAFRYKELGIYKGITWKEYREQVEDFAFGLIGLGLKPGNTVAIMADPCPEWFYADMAILMAGGIDFGIYTTSSVKEMHYSLEVGQAVLFIAENQEYVDKIFTIIDHLPRLSKIIIIDTSTMFMYDDPRLISFEEVQQSGHARKATDPDQLKQRVSNLHPDLPATIIFTSGTAGLPKPSLLSHQNILGGLSYVLGEVIPEVWDTENRSICHLSLAHLLERGASVYDPLFFPLVPHIGESLQYLQETLFEVEPTFFYGVPRIFEKIAAQAIVGIENSAWIKRKAYQYAMSWGRAYIHQKWKGGKVAWTHRLLYWLATQICFRQLLHHLGFKRIRYCIVTGAPVPPAVQTLWQIWGVDMINIYGSTEGGFICAQRPGFPKPGTVGKPSSINKIDLTEEGEVTISGPGVFLGYLKMDEATREVKREGRLYTGDIGMWTDDGYLKIIDRKKDIMITAGGKNITPSEIENALKASPYISEAVIIAEGRKFPSALVEIDFETTSDWARRNRVLYTGFTSLTAQPKVIELIDNEIKKANESMARVEQVKKFRIIPKELDPEEGDTTATRKIKRKTIYTLFRDLIEDMYVQKETDLFESQLNDLKNGN